MLRLVRGFGLIVANPPYNIATPLLLGWLRRITDFDGLTLMFQKEVAERIVDGQANKVIALDLGLSERTVELHRARVMQKMEVRGLAQLVQLWLLLSPAQPPS